MLLLPLSGLLEGVGCVGAAPAMAHGRWEMCRGAHCRGSSAGIWVFGTGSCALCSTSSSPVAAGEKGPVLKFLKLLELSSERCALSSIWWLFPSPSSAQPNLSTSVW